MTRSRKFRDRRRSTPVHTCPDGTTQARSRSISSAPPLSPIKRCGVVRRFEDSPTTPTSLEPRHRVDRRRSRCLARFRVCPLSASCVQPGLLLVGANCGDGRGVDLPIVDQLVPIPGAVGGDSSLWASAAIHTWPGGPRRARRQPHWRRVPGCCRWRVPECSLVPVPARGRLTDRRPHESRCFRPNCRVCWRYAPTPGNGGSTTRDTDTSRPA